MDKQAIEKAAVCYWSAEDESYVAESLIFQRCGGTGDTREEAWRQFKEFLNEMYIAYKEGKLAGYAKPGRPSKGATGVHVRLQPSTKDRIDELAEQFGISQGEVIDYLANYQEVAVLPTKPGTRSTKPISIAKVRRAKTSMRKAKVAR